MERHQAGIALSDMPKTYKDAIEIARGLEIPYIWIDSICIVQDDKSDWEREAASMASIYANAQLTLVAAWGEDGNSGCFHNPALPFVVDFDHGRKLYVRPLADHNSSLGDAALNSRAWALQELVLSRRLLIFTEDQMYWVCKSSYRFEDGVDASDFESLLERMIPRLGATFRTLGVNSNNLYTSWYTAMQSYTTRSLTHGADKLAALAGVTQTFQKITMDKPLVGFWKDDIVSMLMWVLRRKSLTSTHPTVDFEAVRALNLPSWSFLKVHGTVSFYFCEPEPCLEILDASVMWTGEPLVSSIARASLTGRGKIIEGFNARRAAGAECMCNGAQFHIDAPLGVKMCFDNTETIWYLDECAPALPKKLSFLLAHVHSMSSSDEVEVSGMLLASEVDAPSTTTYRRLGVIQLLPLRQDFDSIPLSNFTLV